MNCIIFFLGNDEAAMKIVELLYKNSLTLKNNNINLFMNGCLSFEIPDNIENKELIRKTINQLNKTIHAQLILGNYFGGTKDDVLNDKFHSEINTRVQAGTLPLNPHIR